MAKLIALPVAFVLLALASSSLALRGFRESSSSSHLVHERMLQTTAPPPSPMASVVVYPVISAYPDWSTQVSDQDVADAGDNSVSPATNTSYTPSDPWGWDAPPPPFALFNQGVDLVDLRDQLDQVERQKVAFASMYAQDVVSTSAPTEVKWAAGNASVAGTSGYGNVPR